MMGKCSSNYFSKPLLLIYYSLFEAYSDYENEVEIMKHLLKIGHWAPICPDIIPSIPFQEGDSLVIDSIPGLLYNFH